jgi:hypothetical protein
MQEIKQLFKITSSLKEKYKETGRDFTLDGKLVGDIGEVLAAEKYGLRLLGKGSRKYDAEEIATGRSVQIKSTFKGYCYFPHDFVPDYFLSVMIKENGDLEEIFNGPGKFVVDNYIKKDNLKGYKNSYYNLSLKKMKELNEKVPEKQKIKAIQ